MPLHRTWTTTSSWWLTTDSGSLFHLHLSLSDWASCSGMTITREQSTRLSWRTRKTPPSLLQAFPVPVSLHLSLSASSFTCNPLSLSGGLAVDWVNDRLYFSYSSAGSSLDQPKHLAYYDLVSGYVTEITDAVVEEERRIRPRSPFSLFFDLAVDPVNE